jgi:predicted transcriptional regulator
MSTKEILLQVAKKLPADATLADAIYELEFRQAVEKGLASLDRGERVTLAQARKQIPKWVSKHSSRKTRSGGPVTSEPDQGATISKTPNTLKSFGLAVRNR